MILSLYVYAVSSLISSNPFSCMCFFSRKNPQQVFKGHRLPGLSAPVDVCGLYPGESHLGRFGSPVPQHGKAISCLAKPALWSGSPNLETITVGLPASAAQRSHRFNKSVHIG